MPISATCSLPFTVLLCLLLGSAGVEHGPDRKTSVVRRAEPRRTQVSSLGTLTSIDTDHLVSHAQHRALAASSVRRSSRSLQPSVAAPFTANGNSAFVPSASQLQPPAAQPPALPVVAPELQTQPVVVTQPLAPAQQVPLQPLPMAVAPVPAQQVPLQPQVAPAALPAAIAPAVESSAVSSASPGEDSATTNTSLMDQPDNATNASEADNKSQAEGHHWLPNGLLLVTFGAFGIGASWFAVHWHQQKHARSQSGFHTHWYSQQGRDGDQPLARGGGAVGLPATYRQSVLRRGVTGALTPDSNEDPAAVPPSENRSDPLDVHSALPQGVDPERVPATPTGGVVSSADTIVQTPLRGASSGKHGPVFSAAAEPVAPPQTAKADARADFAPTPGMKSSDSLPAATSVPEAQTAASAAASGGTYRARRQLKQAKQAKDDGT